MTPRPYQVACIEQTIAAFEQSLKVLGVLPTGGGKTIIFSMLIQKMRELGLVKRALILAHREELIDQAIDKLRKATGLFAQKEKAEFKASLNSEVVVASVQSFGRRLAKWPGNHFDLIVVDEAHHAIADSYQRILRHCEGCKVLGVTATPDRGDRKNLGQYFERNAFDISLFELIRQGFLSRIAIQSIPLKIDISSVAQTAGDFSEVELGEALRPYLHSIAAALKTHAGFRKTLVFVPLIATSKEFVEICQETGIRARHIDGTSEDRKEILAAFREGEYDLLSNAMLLTEGYDEPSVDCVVVLRPTRSRSLYAQMVGRGTRIFEGKENLLLLDFLWLYEKHRLVHPSSLVACDAEESDIITQITEAPGGGEAQDLEVLAGRAKADREEKLRRELEAKRKKSARYIDAGELSLFMHQPELANCEPTFPWESEGLTENQRSALEKWGIDLETVNNRGHAGRILEALIARSKDNLATPKQVRLLNRFKYRSPEHATFEEANAFLNRRLAVRK